MNPVNWFEIPVRDMAKARKFYESVFGMPLENTALSGILKIVRGTEWHYTQCSEGIPDRSLLSR
jgi:predicted enzyme related to lactoylglutathione lyase